MGCLHSTVIGNGSKRRVCMEHRHMDPPLSPEILQLAALVRARSHTFTEKIFRSRRLCDVCRRNIENPGAFCKECKVAAHQKCAAKLKSACISESDLNDTIQSTLQKKRGSLPRSKSVELVMEHVMEHHYDFDLTYITERIISVFFLPDLEEQRYRGNLQEVAAMLKSKHQDKFLLLNLSEKRHDIIRLNPKVQDYGWPDLHAPPLDRICAVCKAMETWLISDPHNVVVLHCKGNKGKTGVIVAAYMHYSKISAGADQALTTLAMRKFCEDKVSSALQPSQNRYVYYFGGLLSGSIKMNSSPLLLHQILIPSLPNFQPGGGYYPFLKIYQSLQLVYTSAVYDPQNSRARKLCMTMDPALLLKGDIMVKCYHRRPRGAQREVVFRVQFHTCTVHGAQLWFGKTELDVACTDDRFPPDATVEFIFSGGPDKMKGQDYGRKDSCVKIDDNTSDPVVRWDSYENFNLHHQDSLENISHTRGPLDGSLYAQVRKRRGPGSTATGALPNGMLPGSPTVTPQTHVSPQPVPFGANPGRSTEPPSPNRQEREGADRMLRRGDGEERTREKTKGKERDRETAILDDVEPSSPERSRRGPAGAGSGDGGWERDREPHLGNGPYLGRCNSAKNNPKSRTLPALPSKPVSPTPHAPHAELCHRHSAHPLPELPWERPLPAVLCVHRPCFPHSTPDLNHAHSHSLPGSNRQCPGEECHLFHYSGRGPSPLASPQSLPTSPYREMFFNPPTAPSGCPCRDCSSRREHKSASLRMFHPLNSDQSGSLRSARDAELQKTREGPPPWVDTHWQAKREADFWQRSPAPYHVCQFPLEQAQSMDPTRAVLELHPGYISPHPHMDGASSGYRTPPPPRPPCACSRYQSSPAESHESRGYASGYHSGSSSPLPPTSPNPALPGRSRPPESPSGDHPQHDRHTEQLAQADVKDQTSQMSSDKEDDQASGVDSDHDYTLISCSPTQSEDRVGEELVDRTTQNSPQGQREPSCGAASSATSLESDADQPTSQTPESNARQNPALIQHTVEKEESHEQSLTATNVEDTQSAEESGQSVTTSPASTNSNTSVLQGAVIVQMQLNGSALSEDTESEARANTPSSDQSSNISEPVPAHSPLGSPARQPSPQPSLLTADLPGQRLSPDGDKPPSPVPDGYSTPTFPLASYYYPLLNVPHVPYSGYTAVTIPASQPPLPEKKRFSSSPLTLNGHNSLLRAASAPSSTGPHHVTFSPSVAELPSQVRRGSSQSSCREEADTKVNAKFVQDSSKYWYKPGISRDQAIAALKDKEPGAFLIRDSNSFQGAYGLALKVSTPPPNANLNASKAPGDPLEQLVRHFLIETGPRGVKIKGCQNESYFGSLSALVYQHSITPISLPCALRVPDKDVVAELQETQSITNTSTAANLLKQGAACNVLYLNSVETESLTGPQAISKATRCTLALNPCPSATVVHFKVSTQGITLTDSKRRLFFRRHYPINSVTFSSVDPKNQRWTNSNSTSSKIFGFVARRTGSATENVCHLFAEMDPEQPAVAIVNFINKVMLGPQLRR